MIYADHAATTAVCAAARAAMEPFWATLYGNPSSLHTVGTAARRALADARARVAACLGAQPEEIRFTSGGSESNNTALRGILENPALPQKRLLFSALEHPSVLRCAALLHARGIPAASIASDPNGFISPDALSPLLNGAPALVSVMTANNEIGTVQPVQALASLCHAHGGLFHTDAVQSARHLPLDVRASGVDLLSLSGHKFGAPKGIGVLFVRRGLTPAALIVGGHQEGGLRAGTENVAFAAALAAALESACRTRAADAQRVCALRDRLWAQLSDLPGIRLNGSLQNRLPGNLNVSFPGLEGEALVTLLDLRGICVSAGSACCAGSVTPSAVLKAIGCTDAEAVGAVRITLGAENTEEEVDAIAAALRTLCTLC